MLPDPQPIKVGTVITAAGAARDYVVTKPADGRSRDFTRTYISGIYTWTMVLRTSSAQSGNVATNRRLSASLSLNGIVTTTGEVVPPMLVSWSALYSTTHPDIEASLLALTRELAMLLAATAEANIMARLLVGEY